MSKKKKNNHKKQTPKTVSPKQYIIEAARKVPIYECWYNASFAIQGVSNCIVVRKKENGNFIIGFYLIDAFGLGLKDTFFRHSIKPFEYKDYMQSFINIEDATKGDPNFVFNLIYGAIEYAEDIGLEPHKDFEITQYILPPADEIEFEDITFGVNGKPSLVLQPHNAGSIIKKVTAAIGEGNFHYIISAKSANDLFGLSEDFYDDDDDDDDYDDDEFTDYQDVTPKK